MTMVFVVKNQREICTVMGVKTASQPPTARKGWRWVGIRPPEHSYFPSAPEAGNLESKNLGHKEHPGLGK